LEGFVLIGGTALAQQLGHRLSEDLDFIWPAGGRLPRGKIRACAAALERSGWTLQSNPSPGLIAEYEDSGDDWADFQQDFLGHDSQNGTVKLTFVLAEPENRRQLDVGANTSGPRVASIAEIFRLKCIAAADRSRSRDWLDLYVLISSGRFGPADFIQAYDWAQVPQKRDIAISRMTSGKLPIVDEGFESLLASPPSIEQLQQFFVEFNDHVQQELARQAFEGLGPSPK